jgi:hypothetical protein
MPKAKFDPKSLELLRRSEAVNEKSLIACHHADLISKRLASTLKRNEALIQSSGNLADFQTLHPARWLNKPKIK